MSTLQWMSVFEECLYFRGALWVGFTVISKEMILPYIHSSTKVFILHINLNISKAITNFAVAEELLSNGSVTSTKFDGLTIKRVPFIKGLAHIHVYATN